MAECPASVVVTAGARLHFGLLDTRAPFGGVGIMIDRPETRVRVSRADSFDAGKCRPERLTQIARRFAERAIASGAGLPPCRIRVEAMPPSHQGFGSGTQVALAAATALDSLFSAGLSRAEIVESIAGRGRRSSVGSLGFYFGGMIAEDGTAWRYTEDDRFRRVEVPADWRVLLIRPGRDAPAISGADESAAFASLPAASSCARQALSELGSRIMDAAAAGRFESFAEALVEFNRLSGELFASRQGGSYNGPEVESLIERVRALGGRGYGQSSWGPTVFVMAPDEDAAQRMAAGVDDCRVTIARPKAAGHCIEAE